MDFCVTSRSRDCIEVPLKNVSILSCKFLPAPSKPVKTGRCLCNGSGTDMDRAFVSETRRETLRRYAIVLRLQDRGSPSCAAPLRLRTPCIACVPAQAFRGLGVRRGERPPDLRLLPPHPPDTRLIPAHPPEPWQISGSPRASPFGRENSHGHFSFLGLTPVGSAPASRGWQRSRKQRLDPYIGLWWEFIRTAVIGSPFSDLSYHPLHRGQVAMTSVPPSTTW